MHNRAMQALWTIALDPVAETAADGNSFGFKTRYYFPYYHEHREMNIPEYPDSDKMNISASREERFLLKIRKLITFIGDKMCQKSESILGKIWNLMTNWIK